MINRKFCQTFFELGVKKPLEIVQNFQEMQVLIGLLGQSAIV